MSTTIEEQIKALEDEIFKTQKNKHTEYHIGKLKAKIARLKEEQDKEAHQRREGRADVCGQEIGQRHGRARWFPIGGQVHHPQPANGRGE